ncbi:MAG: WG repeat-containing protein, partial [Bacteroidota bacterium]
RTLTDFQEGLAVVSHQGKYGYADRDLNLVGGIPYQDAKPYSEGLAAVKQGGKWGFVNRQQEIIIDYQFQNAEEFRDGLATVRGSNGRWGLIDPLGQVKLPFEYAKPLLFEREDQVPEGAEALAVIYVEREPKGKYQFINKEGKLQFPDTYFQFADNFQGAYARVVRYDQTYSIDRRGECVARLAAEGKCPQEKWDRELLRVIRSHRAGVTAVRFSSNGRRLATASLDSSLQIWQGDGRGPIRTFRHKSWVRDVAINRTGTQVYSGTQAGVVTLWSTEGGQLAQVTLPGQVWKLALSEDNRNLAVSTTEGVIYLLDSRTLSSQRRFRLPNGLKADGLSFTANGNYLLAGTEDGVLRIWSMGDGSLRQLATGAPIQSLAISPNGQHVAIGDRLGSIKYYRLTDLSLIEQYQAHRDWVSALDFDPDGEYLMSAGRDRSLRVYDLEENRWVLQLTLRTTLTAAQFDRKGKTLAVATQGPTGKGLDQVLLFEIDRY